MKIPCTDCDGTGEVRASVHTTEAACDLEDCTTCDGAGVVELSPLDADDEPADIDDDRFTNPYTGACEDEGYDTGSDW